MFGLSAISLLEPELGVLRLKRRDAAQGDMLRRWLEDQVLTRFRERILPVDAEVARQCARLLVPDLRTDRDALIAATALLHGVILVTRNAADFAATGGPAARCIVGGL